MVDQTLQEAARHFVHPVDEHGNISPMYADKNTDIYYCKMYGEKVWKEACTKARTEYNFGSSAVRW